MYAIVDVCIIPVGVETSVSRYVTECVKVLNAAGLKTHVHAYGTNVEGEWDVVFNAIKRCHETLHDMGAPRISTTIRCGTRTDKHQTIKEKLESVKAKA